MMLLLRCLYVLQAVGVVGASVSSSSIEGDHPEYYQLQALAHSSENTALAFLEAQNGTGTCTQENVKIRREW